MGPPSFLCGSAASVFLDCLSPRCLPAALCLPFVQWEPMHWPQWWIQKQTLQLVIQLSQQHSVRGRQQSSLRHASELSLSISRTISRNICIVSLAASTTVDARAIFGIYVRIGLAIMILPCFDVTWAYRSFQAIIYLSIPSGVYWIGYKLWSMKKDIKLG